MECSPIHTVEGANTVHTVLYSLAASDYMYYIPTTPADKTSLQVPLLECVETPLR
jgi:hypothetical protein